MAFADTILGVLRRALGMAPEPALPWPQPRQIKELICDTACAMMRDASIEVGREAQSTRMLAAIATVLQEQGIDAGVSTCHHLLLAPADVGVRFDGIGGRWLSSLSSNVLVVNGQLYDTRGATTGDAVERGVRVGDEQHGSRMHWLTHQENTKPWLRPSSFAITHARTALNAIAGLSHANHLNQQTSAARGTIARARL